MREADYTRQSKNAGERECKDKTRNMRQSEGKCETAQGQAQEAKHEQEMEHSKHAQKSISTHEKAAALEYNELVR